MVNITAGSKENLDRAWGYYDSLPRALKQLVSSIKSYDPPINSVMVAMLEINLYGTDTEIYIPAEGHVFKSAGVRNGCNFVTFIVGELEVEYKIEVVKNENHLFFALNQDGSIGVAV